MVQKNGAVGTKKTLTKTPISFIDLILASAKLEITLFPQNEASKRKNNYSDLYQSSIN